MNLIFICLIFKYYFFLFLFFFVLILDVEDFEEFQIYEFCIKDENLFENKILKSRFLTSECGRN